MSEEFSLEKLGILNKLNEIQLSQVEKNAKLDEVLRMVTDHQRTLYGVNGDPGLSTIVDRLQQTEDTRNRHFWVLYPAIALSLFKHAANWINGK